MPDFRVTYQLFTPEDGGRKTPAYQHIRWDFRFEDKAVSTGTFMLYPEFLTLEGEYYPENVQLPMVGIADMFALSSKLRPFLAEHIRPGVRAYFMEGSQRVGVCEVLEITGLRPLLRR